MQDDLRWLVLYNTIKRTASSDYLFDVKNRPEYKVEGYGD
jgi:hypothetical protein